VPLQKLQLRPGVNRESTTLANEGTWFEMDKVRFRSGYPEKIGGWEQDTGSYVQDVATTAPPPTGSFWGQCRSLWNWITLSSLNLLGVGTNLKFYIQNGVDGTFNDITPIRFTTPAGQATFASTNNSTTLTVTDAGHGAQAGDFVTFTNAAGLGNNITATVLNREFQVQTVISDNVYTITSSIAASSTTTGGGGATIAAYQITTGSDVYTISVGWGAGGWGGISVTTPATTLSTALPANTTTVTVSVASTTGFLPLTSGSILIDQEILTYASKTSTTFVSCSRAQSGTSAASHSVGAVVQSITGYTGWGQAAPSGVGLGTQLRLWSQSNYGEDLIFSPRGGAMYYWATNVNPSIFNRGVILQAGTTVNGVLLDAYCPSVCNFVMVSDASRFVVAFGANDYDSSTQNPLLIRWSNQEDYGTWYPSPTNQAGSYQLSHGSSIITAMQARQEILIWTDATVYSMQYLGPPYVWGFQILADNISIISPSAVASANNVTYWMGVDKFYTYSGRVETLYCPLRQYIFGNINLAQAFQFFGGTNEGFNEVWWFYCSITGPNGTGTPANPNTTIDRYVIYNYLEKNWSYGTLARTAWLDSPLRNTPTATTSAAQLVYHEQGVDNGTTNPPSAIESYIQSADFNIGDGHNYGFVWRMIPDITFDGSYANQPSVTFTMKPRQNPGADYSTEANPTVRSTQNYSSQRNYTVQQFTQIIYVRVRGRQMAFEVRSTGVGVAWQLGVPSIDVRPDGRR